MNADPRDTDLRGTPVEERSVGSAASADEEVATLARALGHPARVRILRLLLERAECVCGEICEELPLAQSTVSQHLKVLKSAGLVRGTVSGPSVCYCADPAVLERLREHVTELLGTGRGCC